MDILDMGSTKFIKSPIRDLIENDEGSIAQIQVSDTYLSLPSQKNKDNTGQWSPKMTALAG